MIVFWFISYTIYNTYIYIVFANIDNPAVKSTLCSLLTVSFRNTYDCWSHCLDSVVLSLGFRRLQLKLHCTRPRRYQLNLRRLKPGVQPLNEIYLEWTKTNFVSQRRLCDFLKVTKWATRDEGNILDTICQNKYWNKKMHSNPF